MSGSGKIPKLTSFDDIFKSEETRQEQQQERVQMIAVTEMDDFPNHPFKVCDDEKMQDTIESIRENGVLVPAIVRPKENGRYEIVSGHRRRYACAAAGIAEIPAIVRDMTDDEAIIIMVDSNLQRETILPSEKAFAYKMKLDAMKRRAGRPSKENMCQVGTHLLGQRSDQIMAKEVSESARTIQRYIRLTELIPDILKMVDEKEISFNAGVEVSYLKKDEQEQMVEIMDYDECIPSLSQAQRLKKSSMENRLTKEVIAEIMSKDKAADIKLTLGSSKIKKYFPREYTSKQMEQVILELLEHWSKEQNEMRK